MSDRQNDVLARIDAETAKCICGQAIPENGVSLDYCSDRCQYGFMAATAGTDPEDDYYSYEPPVTDGRAINEELNRRFQPGAITDSYEYGLLSTVNERLAADGYPHLWRFRIADLRHVATFQRPAPSPVPSLSELLRRDTAPAVCEPARPAASTTTVTWIPNVADVAVPVAEISNGRTISVSMSIDITPFISSIRILGEAARSAGGAIREALCHTQDLDVLHATVGDDALGFLEVTGNRAGLARDIAQAGVTLGQARDMAARGVPAHHMAALASYPPDRAASLYQLHKDLTFGGISPDYASINALIMTDDEVRALGKQAADLFGGTVNTGPTEPLAGKAFRQHALEHQQNRGTGPKPGRRIPPRDLRR